MTRDQAVWLAVGGLAVLCAALLVVTVRGRRSWVRERNATRAEVADLLVDGDPIGIEAEHLGRARSVDGGLDALSRHEYPQAADVYQNVLVRWAEIRGRELSN